MEHRRPFPTRPHQARPLPALLRLALLVLAASVLLPGRAGAMRAGNLGESMTLFEGETPVSLQLSGGYLQGRSEELVFEEETGRKVSELDWDLRNIYMLGGTVSVGTADWLLLNLGGWAAVNRDSGRMTDYDWMDAATGDWSDRSVHRTKLDHGYMLDVNAMFPVSLREGVSVAPMVGFKVDNWKWHDEDSNHIYSDVGWRDDVGRTDGTSIIYEQWFYTPYAGLCAGAQFGDFRLGAYARGTLWAWARDKDQHLARNTVFTGEFSGIHYYGVGAEASYAVTQRFSVGLAYDYQEYLRTKGDMTVDDRDDGERATARNGGGVSHHSSMVTLSLRYAF